MVGRTREFDIERATEAATDLFWSNGYVATSLSELIEATELSKGSFYHAFGSKHDLFERCLAHYENTLVDAMDQMLTDSNSGFDFIRKLFASIAKETRGPNARRGCLIMNTASELAQSDADISKSIRRGKKRMLSVLTQAVHRAQEAREISQSLDPNDAAAYLLMCMSGLKTMVKSGDSAAAITTLSELVLRTLSD